MKCLCLLLFIFLLVASLVCATDEYKPYLHKPQVPETPKVRLFGAYQTDLFPGAATYSYPIDVPPGTQGLQPSLSLLYSSQGAKSRPGILGSGWEFTRDYLIKNLNGTVLDTSDDFYTLFLNGRSEKLVVNGTELKTEVEYGARIDAHLGANTSIGTYWVVTTKDGTQYRFGYTSDSEIVSGVSTVWNLDQVTDTYGNTIGYFYDVDPYPEDINAFYLSRIEYNRDKERVIRFGYEGTVRPDRRRVIREGGFFEESRRLTSIEVFAKDALVRRYSFAYTNLSLSATSLATIKQYGNDNTSLLHTVSFAYDIPEVGFVNQTSLWASPTILASSASVDYGVRPLDVNNDGFVDFLKARNSTLERSTFLNNKLGEWTSTTNFLPPIDFVYGPNDLDNGVRFADIDQDGRLDILQSSNNGGDIKKVFINNDTNWTDKTSSWALPVYFVVSDVDQGTELVDVNGDGKTDIIQANDAGSTVYLNTGVGWSSAPSWNFPTVLMNASSDSGARIVDLNGDGLPDVIRSTDLFQQVWLNNGSGWQTTDSWSPPTTFKTTTIPDTGVRLVDVNSDGLVDLVQGFFDGTLNRTAWINTGASWQEDASWAPPEAFVDAGKNTGRRLTDVNGDGLSDFMVMIGNESSQGGNTYLKTNSYGYFLKSITNEYGGVVTINYTHSTQFDNTGADTISDLGFAVNVVNVIAKNNTMNGAFNIFATTHYNYSGGLFDATNVQFRGFSNVTETLPDLTLVKHHFLQDDSRKGKEWKTETFGTQGLLSVSLMNYSSIFLVPNYRVVLESATSLQYDGNVVPFETRTAYAYDNYLNVIEKDSFGDVANDDDDRIEKYEYEYAINKHIVEKPSKYQLLSGDNSTKVKESSFSYDDGIINRGSLTRQENWNDRGDNVVTHFTYDDYGNRISSVDGLGHVTNYEYGLRDSTFTFLDRMTNALGHKEEYVYDLGTGNLLSQTKNEITTSFVYDAFGRIVKEIKPYDSESLPTKTYNYTFDGTAPEEVSLSLRETANVKNRALQYFYDGFANVVQIRSEADNYQFIVKNLYYDGLGRVYKEDNPYFGTSTTFQPPLNNTPFANYSYDALGRVFYVLNPDGSNKTIQFNRTVITDFDENGHKHAYHLDGFGQIATVQEFNNDPLLGMQLDPYNTTYLYDDQGNLVLITDNEGNEFKFTYDSLGRKVALDDPDLGHWTYAYDSANNLIRQTDNRGIAINLAYDSLNRISQKRAINQSVNFSYDGQFEGVLSNLSDPNSTFRYTYDDRMRVVSEEILIDGVWTVTGFTYDSMDRVVEQQLPHEVLEYYYSKQGQVQKIPGYIDYSSYNAFGSLLGRNYSTGRFLEFTYNDTNNRLVRMTNGLAQRIDYRFDAVGNALLINDTINNRAHQLSYDNLDRLHSAIVGSDVFKYEYDPLGRILKTQENSLVRRYEYLGLQAHAPTDIITRVPDAEVHAAQDLDTNSKSRVYEFYLVNETGGTTSQNWSLSVAGTTITSDQINLSEPLLVLVEYNHSVGGSYPVNVSVKNDSSTFLSTFGLTVADVEGLAQEGSRHVTELIVDNDLGQTITGVNWTCGTISASQKTNISGNSELIVLVEQNYSTSGIVKLNCSARSNDGNDSLSNTFNLRGLSVEEMNTLSQNINTKIVSFNLFNYHAATSLTFNTSTAEQNFSNTTTMATDAFIMVLEEMNYSHDGQKNVTVAIGSSLLNESASEKLILEALKITYDRYDDNSSTQIAFFDLDNDWTKNLTISFNATLPAVTNATNVSSNKTVMVFIEESYASGESSPLFTAIAQNFTATLRDVFTIIPVDLLNYEILQQNRSSTIAQFDIRNNDNLTNVSWRMDTGQTTLVSNMTTPLNSSDVVFVFVETNYTSNGVYSTTGTANSSQNSDNSTGVVVT